MKKNAGISTTLLTGMAAFVSVFAMVLLIVLRGTIGGGSNNEQAIQEASEKYEAIRNQFVLDISGADINVYWDRKMTAVVCIGNEKFSVIWKDTNIVYHAAALYEGDNLSAEDKEEQAKEKAEALIHGEIEGTTKQVLGTTIHAFYVETGMEKAAKLTVKVNYTDSDKKQQVYEQECEQAYSDGAIAYRTAHQ